MSDTVKAVLIDGKPIGYFPPTSAENVTYEEGVSVKDALDEGMVKVGTVLGTTSSSGNLVTNLKVSDINIIAARCNVSGSITMVAEVATTPPTYGFHVANYDANMTALTSTAVEIKYYYL